MSTVRGEEIAEASSAGAKSFACVEVRIPHAAASFWKALRPQHWLKNLLVFVPVMAAHRFHDIALLEKPLLAFVAFGCCASAGYLFNDLIDLEADRHHPQKRFRPLAAGDVPLSYVLT